MKIGNKDIPWLETPVLVCSEAIDKSLNPDDDIKRELNFYNFTMENAVKAIIKLKELKESINRPGDFFAEMIKSDFQMQAIRKQIVMEQQRIKKFEQKKNKIQNVKFAKAMKDNVSKDKADFKRKTKEGLDSWKKRKYFFTPPTPF
jgi:rRNA-processing protein EBP2